MQNDPFSKLLSHTPADLLQKMGIDKLEGKVNSAWKEVKKPHRLPQRTEVVIDFVDLWVSTKDSSFYLPSPFPISDSFLPPKCAAAEVNCDKGRCQEEQQQKYVNDTLNTASSSIPFNYLYLFS